MSWSIWMSLFITATLPARAQDRTTARGTWEFGAAGSYGFAPDYAIGNDNTREAADLQFTNFELAAGRLFCNSCRHFQPEALLEIMPVWVAVYPKQTHTFTVRNPPISGLETSGPFSSKGASVTPLLVRLLLRDRESEARLVPWVQLGGGILWTDHKFPLRGGSTSVINFTPQGAIGANIYTRPHQSVQLGIKAVHISNAGLGDMNPGVNITVQFTAGYSWWR